MAPMYYKTAAAAIVCFDAASYQSFTVMRDWLDELHRNISAGSIVIAIAATKCDLLVDKQILKEAEDLAQAVGAIFVDTSAKQNYRVNDLFQRVAERVLRFRDTNNHVFLPVKKGICVNEHGQVVNRRFNGSVDNVEDEEHPDIDASLFKKSSPKPYVLPTSSNNKIAEKNNDNTNHYDNSHQAPIEDKQVLNNNSSTDSVLCGAPLMCGIFSKNNTINTKSNSDDPCFMS